MALTAAGLKTPAQTYKIYVAEGTDPADPGEWTLATSLRFESLQANSGAAPSVCTISEVKAPPTSSWKSEGSPPGFATADTGAVDGDWEPITGTLFRGAELDVDYLVRVEGSTLADPATYVPIFIGVVVRPQYDLANAKPTWVCEDYRHFMRKVPIYGRYVYDVTQTTPSVFIKGLRTTFNEAGKPDRGQLGTTLDPGGSDLQQWVPPFTNRADLTYPGAPADPTKPWSDYWLAGHVWNYLWFVYFQNSSITEVEHLNMTAFITLPQASETEGEDLYWLFENDIDGRVMVSDLALTGVDMAKALSALLRKAGPYDWTLVPNADGETCDVVPFMTHGGDVTPGTLSYTWGDYGKPVAGDLPEVIGGQITRDRTDFYNRGYAVSRRHIVETSLTTVAAYFSAGAPASLFHDAASADVTAYCAARAAGSANARKETFYGDVFRRFRVPRDYDWAANVLNTAKTLPSPIMRRRLETYGWALRSAFDPDPQLRQLPAMAWRSKDGGTTWEPKPDYINLTLLGDSNIGVKFSANARDGNDPWTWNGNTTSPQVYDILVTVALDLGEPLDYAIDNSSGARARECFLDCGNTIPAAKRIYCVLPTNGDGNPTADAPSGQNTFGSPANPDIHVVGQDQIEAELSYAMHIKNATCVQGKIELAGLHFDPYPVGYLFGDLLVAGDDPKRTTMNLNACIRSAKFDRATDTTTYMLDGR